MTLFRPTATALSVVLLTTLSACNTTTLKVDKLTSDDSTERRGYVYPLQFTQYEIKVTRGIANCESVIELKNEKGEPLLDDDNNVRTETVPDVKALIKAEILVENVDDADNMYVIDSNSLVSGTKITNITVNWKDGRLTSINAKADDQTAEIINAAVSGVAQLATSAIAPAGLGIKSTSPPPIVACKDDIATAVGNVADHEKKITDSATKISGYSSNIVNYKNMLDQIGSNPTLDCKVPANKDEIQCKLVAAVVDLKKEKDALDGAKKDLSSELEKISYVEVYRWPESSKIDKTNAGKPFGIDEKIYERWLKDDSLVDKNNKIIEMTGFKKSQASMKAFKSEFDIHMQLKLVGNYGVKKLAEYEDKQKGDSGIRYRIPATGYVVVCKKALCTKDEKLAVAFNKGKIHQLGHIFYVPFESDSFTNREFSMSFDDNGLPVSASSTQKKAAGENMANVFKNAATEVANYRKVRAEAKKTKTELELLEEQTALINAQKALANAKENLTPSESTALLTELKVSTDLAIAQKKYLDALFALDDNMPDEIDENTQAAAVIRGETTVLLAEAAQLEAILALKEAEKALAKFSAEK